MTYKKTTAKGKIKSKWIDFHSIDGDKLLGRYKYELEFYEPRVEVKITLNIKDPKYPTTLFVQEDLELSDAIQKDHRSR